MVDQKEKNQFQGLVEAVNENFQQHMKGDDAMDVYFHSHCHKWLKECQAASARVESGYTAILQELQK